MSSHHKGNRVFCGKQEFSRILDIVYDTLKIFTAVDPFSNHYKTNRRRQYLEARIRSGFMFTSTAPTGSFSPQKNVAL